MQQYWRITCSYVSSVSRSSPCILYGGSFAMIVAVSRYRSTSTKNLVSLVVFLWVFVGKGCIIRRISFMFWKYLFYKPSSYLFGSEQGKLWNPCHWLSWRQRILYNLCMLENVLLDDLRWKEIWNWRQTCLFNILWVNIGDFYVPSSNNCFIYGRSFQMRTKNCSCVTIIETNFVSMEETLASLIIIKIFVYIFFYWW